MPCSECGSEFGAGEASTARHRRLHRRLREGVPWPFGVRPRPIGGGLHGLLLDHRSSERKRRWMSEVVYPHIVAALEATGRTEVAPRHVHIRPDDRDHRCYLARAGRRVVGLMLADRRPATVERVPVGELLSPGPIRTGPIRPTIGFLYVWPAARGCRVAARLLAFAGPPRDFAWLVPFVLEAQRLAARLVPEGVYLAT